MADQRLRITNFGGGLSDDSKYGSPNSASVIEAIDFRRSPGMATLKQKLVKESSTTIITEVHDAVRVDDGVIYLAGGTEIYKRAPGTIGNPGTYSVESSDASLINVRDFDYRQDIKKLFAYDDYFIHEFSPIGNSPTWSYDKYGYLIALDDGFTENLPNASALPTTIDEDAETEIYSFVATHDPYRRITFSIVTKGTGNWTMTLHDDNNNVVATQTVTNASQGSNLALSFTINSPTSPIRFKLGATYHVHLTVSIAGGTIDSELTNDIRTAGVQLTAFRLIPGTRYGHPTIQSGNKTFFCNERYLGEWELLDTSANGQAGYDPHRLVFPAECDTNGVALYNEYVAVSAAVDNASDSNAIQGSKGIIFFWDQVSDFVTFSLPVPQGVPNSLFAADNALFFEAGGRWHRWAGGDIETIFEFPTNELSQTDVPSLGTNFPARRHVQTMRDNLVLIGWPGEIPSVSQEPYFGIFSYGKSKSSMPIAVGFDAFLSPGNISPTIIGGVSSGITYMNNFGGNLLVAWRDVVNGTMVYGVDFLNESSVAAPNGRWLCLWFDNNDPDKEKTPKAIKVTFDSLPVGCSITPIIEYDRNEAIKSGEIVSTPGAREAVFHLSDQVNHPRFYEVRFGFDLASSQGNFPRVRSVTLKFDDNREDEQDTEVER